MTECRGENLAAGGRGRHPGAEFQKQGFVAAGAVGAVKAGRMQGRWMPSGSRGSLVTPAELRACGCQVGAVEESGNPCRAQGRVGCRGGMGMRPLRELAVSGGVGLRAARQSLLVLGIGEVGL